MNIDTLVSAGFPPWLPSHEARELDIWDKYDFPLHGTFRLGDTLVVFTLITIAGDRSLWAYAPVPVEDEEKVLEAQPGSEEEFEEFLRQRFQGQVVLFAAADDFIVKAKSDGISIGNERQSWLLEAARWYAGMALALASAADEDVLLRDMQRILADLSI
jgi:hypothetical protein